MTSAAIDFDDDRPSPTTAWAYRRRARRLRYRHRNDPVALHLSLKTLATELDAGRPAKPVRHAVPPARPVAARPVTDRPVVTRATGAPPDESAVRQARSAVEAETIAASRPVFDPAVSAALDASPETVERFAKSVRSMLDATSILRFSQRQALLREAQVLGIGQFEASLVIAAVEHRRRTYSEPTGSLPVVRRRSVVGAVALVLALETVALGAWFLLM